LNRALAAAFVAFAERRIRSTGPIKKSEIELSHSQYGNFQKLRHFQLIQKGDDQTWEMTPFGWEFLTGNAMVLNPAGQFGNATLGPDNPAWLTHKGERKAVSIREILPVEWKERLDYVAEKRGAA
jgi:hypothetical protein